MWKWDGHFLLAIWNTSAANAISIVVKAKSASYVTICTTSSRTASEEGNDRLNRFTSPYKCTPANSIHYLSNPVNSLHKPKDRRNGGLF